MKNSNTNKQYAYVAFRTQIQLLNAVYDERDALVMKFKTCLTSVKNKKVDLELCFEAHKQEGKDRPAMVPFVEDQKNHDILMDLSPVAKDVLFTACGGRIDHIVKENNLAYFI